MAMDIDIDVTVMAMDIDITTCRKGQSVRSDAADQRVRQSRGVVPPPGCTRIVRVLPHRFDRRRPLEPPERVVEPLPDDALQSLVPRGALRTERVPLPMPPRHAAREQHRGARPGPLFNHRDVDAELAKA